jgi:hypothetical protein
MGFRNLLGSAKAINHDPGAQGESGEGDAAMAMLCLTFVIAIVIIVYGASPLPTLPPLNAATAGRTVNAALLWQSLIGV